MLYSNSLKSYAAPNDAAYDRSYECARYGYSAIEMMLALGLIGLIVFFSVRYSNSLFSLTKAENTTQQAYNYSQAVVRYISTHQNLLRNLLPESGESNGQFATVSTQILRDEGFIQNDVYWQNNLKQYPCTIIYSDKRQLQSFIYYRTDGDDIKLDKRQLNDGLNHMGAMIGLYENGVVHGAGKDWSLTSDFTRKMFLNQGPVDISQGVDTALYTCSGTAIANKSYVVNITTMLTLNNKLPLDDTIHQYQDQLHGPDELQSNNRMNTDLIMDYKDKSGGVVKSNVIFQMNPDCVMDPTNIATLQDYDPNIDGRDSPNVSKANSLGCKNRQLAIAPGQDRNGNPTMTVTGFYQGGYKAPNSNFNPDMDNRPFVGEIRAAALQPTAQIPVGTACKAYEISKIAQQKKSTDPEDVNNIYVSQVMCMKNPVCAASTGGYCYMPVQSVTIRYKPNTNAFICPLGTFIDSNSVVLTPAPQPPACHAHDCFDQPFDCHYKTPRYQSTQTGVIYNERLSSQAVSIYRGANVDNTLWISNCGTNECHAGCRATGEGPDWPTQGTIASIDCTNDPNKAAIELQGNN